MARQRDGVSRRTFLRNVTAGTAGFAIVPRHVLGRGFTAPSDTLNIAGVGVGGMGKNNLINLATQNIVAMCDVDWDYAGKSFDHLDTEIANLRTRIEQGPPPPRPGQPPIEFDPVKARTQLQNTMRFKTEHVPRAK